MNNLIKGWITTIGGLIGAVCISLHAVGIYEFPNPSVLDKPYEVGIGLIVCAGLFFMPYSKIEGFVEQLWSALINIFKKKGGV